MKATALMTMMMTVALMSGCASNGILGKGSTYDAHSVGFSCDSGLTPTITYLNDSQISLTLDGTSTTLTRAVSGSGVRYVTDKGIFGTGGEWHEKGDDAIFAYKNVHGVDAQSSCQAVR